MEEERAPHEGGQEVVVASPAPRRDGGADEGRAPSASSSSAAADPAAASVGSAESPDEDPSESGDDDDSRRSHGSNSDDDDDDDTWGDEDYENALFVDSFREAAEHLEEADGGPIESLCVCPPHPEDQDDEDDEEEGAAIRGGGGSDNGAASFRRLVAALGIGLGRPQGGRGRRRGRTVRAIALVEADWEGVREEDVERLCRDVLPAHPTLEEVTIDAPSRFVRLLASSIRAGRIPPLRKLDLCGVLDRDAVQAVADMLRRNVPLAELNMATHLEADHCRLICQSLLCNTHIRALHLFAKGELDNALDGVVARSSLRTLVVSAKGWSEECVASVARQLRTNTALESLHLSQAADGGSHSPFFRPIKQVLETYNVTLRKVTFRFEIPRQPQHVREAQVLSRLLRRNRRIRRAVRQLDPRSFHLEPCLWPRALGFVSTHPALVHRFLRRGNVNALCDVLRRDRAAGGGSNKRARRASTRGDTM